MPNSIIQERILLEENTKSEMNKEIETMVSKSKNKEYKKEIYEWVFKADQDVKLNWITWRREGETNYIPCM